MGSVTEKQLQVISYIENNLGISFNGNSMSDAQQFISINMEKSRSAHKTKRTIKHNNTRIYATNKKEVYDSIFGSIGNTIFQDAYYDDDFGQY